MMLTMRLALLATGTILCAKATDGVLLQNRLQAEHRRRKAFDFADLFVDIVTLPVSWINVDLLFSGWNALSDVFPTVPSIDPIDIAADTFAGVWDDAVHGMEEAWEWTEDAAVTAWASTEDFFEEFGCAMEDIWWNGAACIKCVKEACNATLDPEGRIEGLDAGNAIALEDQRNGFDPWIAGCASLMEGCPSLLDCEQLSNLTPSAQSHVATSIAQCNICYQCLPWGSTQERCQYALDEVMPNNCKGCTEEQTMMYNAFYSCSSLEAVYLSIADIGVAYGQGGRGREFFNHICDRCPSCSHHEKELFKTCNDWFVIRDGWDNSIPEYERNSLTSQGWTPPSQDLEKWDCRPPAIPKALVGWK